MQVNFKAPIINLDDGEQFWEPPMVRGRPVDGEPVLITLGHICIRILTGSGQAEDDKHLSAEEVDRRYDLAMRIRSSEAPIDVDEKDRTLLQKLIRKRFAVGLAAPCCRLLADPKPEPTKES